MQHRPLAVASCALILSACGATGHVHQPPADAVAQPPTLSPAVAVGADTVAVMGAGPPTFSRIRDLIAGSRQAVHVEMYEFGRRDLAQALIEARMRGVAVTVIVDPSVRVTAETVTALRAGGVDVVEYPIGARMIDHVKLLVVDADVAVVGGINWGAGSQRNHDFDAVLRGPAVANLDRVFLRDLVTSGRRVTVPDAVNDPSILVAATDPAPDIRPLALSLLESAQRSITIEQFVLTDTGIVQALVDAHRRGVMVRVLVDPGQRPTDPHAATLRDAGIDVRLYRGHGEKLHAKAAVADGQTVLFGSANWTNGGFQRNHEIDVEITGSPAVAREFENHMNADWAASAT